MYAVLVGVGGSPLVAFLVLGMVAFGLIVWSDGVIQGNQEVSDALRTVLAAMGAKAVVVHMEDPTAPPVVVTAETLGGKKHGHKEG